MNATLIANEQLVAFLRRSALFRVLDEPWLRLMSSNPITQQLWALQPGEWILAQDSLMPEDVGILILMEGLAHVLRKIEPSGNRGGKEAANERDFRHVAFRHPPQTSGALLSLSRVPAEVGVRCITPCLVMRLHIEDYRLAIRNSERFAQGLYEEWSRRFRQYAVRAEWGKYLSQEEAVAAFFYEAGLALRRCETIPQYLPMKQHEIARFVGVPFDKLRLKILSKFREKDLIRVAEMPGRTERGKIYIPDPSLILSCYPRCNPNLK